MFPTPIERFEFGERLNTLLSPARPIQSIEYLQGRAKELDKIEKSLFARGRHIFIYGDRGVGKSSLAAAAANQCQSTDSPYIDVSCGPDSTLKSIVANIAYQAMNSSRVRKTKLTTNAAIEYRFLKLGASKEVTHNDLYSEIHTLLDAVAVLQEVASIHSERPIVVLDEFDRLENKAEAHLFADLVKQLGDKKVNITFFFTGVGKTLEELLGAHPSAIRQFETIELLKLSWDARWDIAKRAANAFGVEIDEQVCVRIAAVSDGYPYYVHLITEKLLWRVWEDEAVITEVGREHYQLALRDAIESINPELKRPYGMAVNQRTEDFEKVLWATADSDYLDRSLKQMYSSYEYIISQQRSGNRVAITYEAFTAIMRRLKSPNCGSVLITTLYNQASKKGWVSYREPLLRGFVRMQAEAHGLELLGERPEAPRQVMHAPSSAMRGYRGSAVPKGVHFGRKREMGEEDAQVDENETDLTAPKP